MSCGVFYDKNVVITQTGTSGDPWLLQNGRILGRTVLKRGLVFNR